MGEGWDGNGKGGVRKKKIEGDRRRRRRKRRFIFWFDLMK